MLFLKLLSAIASLFAIYPLLKFARKDEINIFDLIILFHSIFFCIIPLFSDYSAFQNLKSFFCEDNIIFSIFIYYIIFITLLLRIDVFWTKHYKYSKNIINITYYIRTLPRLDISWVFVCILFLNLIISWFWYLPQASYFDTFDDFTQSQGIVKKTPFFLLYGTIFTLCFSFSLILYLKENLTFKKAGSILIVLIGFSLLLLFMPRRTMLFYLLLSLIIVYSVKRNFFTKKRITYFIVILFILLKVYFPFYNVMRRTSIQIETDNFITSLLHIIEDTNSRFQSNKEKAAELSESRALNLYYGLYRIIKYDKTPSNGKLFVAAVDHAIPKFINPNKGAGTSLILENKMQCKNDQADSILLLGYGDFGLYLGAFYSFLLFLLIIIVYNILNVINCRVSNHGSTIDILLVVNLIFLSWNVESSLDGYFSSFVQLIIMSIILLQLNRINIIGYSPKH